MTNADRKSVRILGGWIIITSLFFNCQVNPDLQSELPAGSKRVVDTDQTKCFNNAAQVSCPDTGQPFYGQDSQYAGLFPDYTDNQDGTVTDNNTGLMWQQDPGQKMTHDQAIANLSNFDLAGYNDWRLPTIKELYSLILFSGSDPSGYNGTSTNGLIPFINTNYFIFKYGDPGSGERIIDSQWTTSSKYVSTTMNGAETVFGVNFADGRIKGYGIDPLPGQPAGKTFYVIYVRGKTNYAQNDYLNNNDGTITDNSTGLMWQRQDSGSGLNWEQALEYAENLNYAGHSDWRLPNAKELQSIIDYSRSPATSGSAAIDPVFITSSIINEAGQIDFPCFWSSTTHQTFNGSGGSAVYVAFGRAMGYMNGQWVDVHGAGSQRSDPKTGDPENFPFGHGPQGDAVRIFNYVRCVRNINN